MIRFLVNTAVYMAAAAIGLIVADVVLDGLSVEYPMGFLSAALIFGLIQALVTPLFERVTERNATALASAVGLFSALVALFLTETIADGLDVDGITSYFFAALVIWLASMGASLILKATVAKKFIGEVRD